MKIEKAKLQREIWALEDSLSLAKNMLRDWDMEIHELTDRLQIED